MVIGNGVRIDLPAGSFIFDEEALKRFNAAVEKQNYGGTIEMFRKGARRCSDPRVSLRLTEVRDAVNALKDPD